MRDTASRFRRIRICSSGGKATKSLVVVVENKLDDIRIGVGIEMDVECESVWESWKTLTVETLTVAII
jgi:hypothetical protein